MVRLKTDWIRIKILIDKLKPVFVEGRIFAAKGTRDLSLTGEGFPSKSYSVIQKNIRIEPYTTFWGNTASSLVTMGSFSYTHSRLPLDVEVGRYCSIASGFRVMGDRHPSDWASTSPVFYNHKTMMNVFMKDVGTRQVARKFGYDRGRVFIGHDVWIGENVTLAHGVRIGNGAIIAANATVTRDVPPYAIVGGVPATTIRMRFDNSTIQALSESEWWLFSPAELAIFDVTDPMRFACSITDHRLKGDINPFMPVVLGYEHFRAIT